VLRNVTATRYGALASITDASIQAVGAGEHRRDQREQVGRITVERWAPASKFKLG
jgi:hypothetical protein